MSALEEARVDRSAFRIDDLESDGGEREYWLSKSPQERLEALELMRQIAYGYDPDTTRLSGFFEIVELE